MDFLQPSHAIVIQVITICLFATQTVQEYKFLPLTLNIISKQKTLGLSTKQQKSFYKTFLCLFVGNV